MVNFSRNTDGTAQRKFSFFRPILAGASLKERLIAALGALIGIALTGLITSALVGQGLSAALIVAPVGASAVLLFAVPTSPLAQPWSIIGGNTLSALVGLVAAMLIAPMFLAIGVAVALAIILMSATRSLHPPGGAAALTAVIAGPVVEHWGWWFALIPVALNSCILVGFGLIFHRLTKTAYPHVPQKPVTNSQHTADPPASARVGFSDHDIDTALARLDQSFDIARDDLAMIFRQVEQETIIRTNGRLLCADIMSRDVIAIDNLSSTQTARDLLIQHNIRTLPVTDHTGALLGTVGLRDLIDDSAPIKTVKQAATAKEHDPAIGLLPILTDGHRHAVIITDQNNHVVGLISQTDLLSAVAKMLPR